MNPEKLIRDCLGYSIFKYADSNARRSTIKSYKTGAVIFNEKTHGVEAVGTSHLPLNFRYDDSENAKRSIHAEDDVLDNIRYFEDKSIFSIFIYTLNWSGTNHATSSRPCPPCAERLLRAGLSHIYYVERDNCGNWNMNREEPARLVERTRSTDRN